MIKLTLKFPLTCHRAQRTLRLQHGKSHGFSGFTLTELLVVIAIIALLAGLLFSTLGKIMAGVHDTKCVSNLRQLGIAINSYANDNEDKLPGPTASGIDRTLATNKNTALIYYLQPYLGLPKPSVASTDPGVLRPEILRCPALTADKIPPGLQWYEVTTMMTTGNKFNYPPNKRYLNDPAPNTGPWGRLNPNGPPVKRALLSSLINDTLKDADGNPINVTLSMIPAIRELDGTSSAWPWPVSPKVLHGDHCNVLFFDWHVGRVSPSEYSF